MASTESLETVLADSQQRIEAAFKSSKRTTSILSTALKASKQGDMAALRRSRKEAVEALRVAQVDVANVAAAWPWDEEDEVEYFRNGSFVQELMASAKSAGLDLFEEEGQVLCYPSIVRVDPGRRLVLIDKRPHRSVRPSTLVGHLKEMQKRPPRLKVDAFLESLFTAWEYARPFRAGPKGPPQGVRVDKIYAALTIAPGSSKEYTKQEFGRDLYVLEASEVRTTRKGARISFSRATGTKASSGVISVVGKDGRRVLYSSAECAKANWGEPVDGRTSVREIASALQIDETTVRTVMQKELSQRIMLDYSLAEDFRIAMMQLCLPEWWPEAYTEEGRESLLQWLRGELRLISAVKDKHIFQPRPCWRER